MINAQFNAVVICEDVRKEISGKDILIGAYGSEIIVHSLPAQLSLAFWMEVTSKKTGAYNFFFRIQAPDPDQKIEFNIGFQVSNPRIPFALFTPQIPIVVDRQGTVKLFAKTAENEKYELIKTREIKYISVNEVMKGMNQGNPSPSS